MTSPDGNWTIVFNGEIYNHNELRDTLQQCGIVFRGRSDTEVICAAVQAWGIQRSVRLLEGMFAIAIWNTHTQTLTLARDRLGEKPLYYYRRDTLLIFGSQLSALRKHPEFRGEIDEESLGLYARHGYIPQPRSIFNNCHQLEPGTTLTIGLRNGEFHSHQDHYWQRNFRSASGQVETMDEYCNEAHRLLSASVRRQMEADVPVGAFLSGGIDSSIVVALMQSHSSRPVRTFTIGFEQQSHDESNHALAIAKALGTQHTSTKLSAADVASLIPNIVRAYDEPFSDSSQIPTYLVSRIARSSVTTALSGDGGDELLCGYIRYKRADDLYNAVRYLPSSLRKFLADSLIQLTKAAAPAGLSTGMVDDTFSALFRTRLVRRATHLRNLLIEPTFEGLYLRMIQQTNPLGPIFGGLTTDSLRPQAPGPSRVNRFDMMMQHDMDNYLLSDILVKVDRAAMSVSLETRVPMLDRSFVEFCRTLPLSAKYNGGIGKIILRRMLARYIPATLFERPKMGFGVPLYSWLRGPLKPWAESFIHGYTPKGNHISLKALRVYWQHLQQGQDVSNAVWNALMFLAWEQSLE